jgi:hypothetical protein
VSSGARFDLHRLARANRPFDEITSSARLCIPAAVGSILLIPLFDVADEPPSVAALSILHLKFVSDYTQSHNPGIALVPVLVLQQVQLCWSLISATIPNLKSFVKSFSSGFGIQLDPSATQAYGSGRSGRTKSNGYELGSVNGKGGSKSRSADQSHNDVEGHTPLTAALPQPEDNKSRDQDSIDSTGSQDHIIRKDVRWNIRYEHHQNGLGPQPAA